MPKDLFQVTVKCSQHEVFARIARAWLPLITMQLMVVVQLRVGMLLHVYSQSTNIQLRLRDTRAHAVRNVLGNVYLSSLTKNLWYEQREQLDSRGGGALSQGAGHDGSFYRYAV